MGAGLPRNHQRHHAVHCRHPTATRRHRSVGNIDTPGPAAPLAMTPCGDRISRSRRCNRKIHLVVEDLGSSFDGGSRSGMPQAFACSDPSAACPVLNRPDPGDGHVVGRPRNRWWRVWARVFATGPIAAPATVPAGPNYGPSTAVVAAAPAATSTLLTQNCLRREAAAAVSSALA
jgi:hypothetical protein